MSDPAIANLEYLRQLIADARAAEPQADMETLRMIQYYGSPMITEPQEDR
jgi:hypothetical protein